MPRKAAEVTLGYTHLLLITRKKISMLVAHFAISHDSARMAVNIIVSARHAFFEGGPLIDMGPGHSANSSLAVCYDSVAE